MRKYNENPKNFPRLCPKLHQGSALNRALPPPKPPATYSDRFLKIVKKTQPANFSLFQPLD